MVENVRNMYQTSSMSLKGAPPIAADLGFSDFGFFSGNDDLWNFLFGFGFWGGLQSIAKSCGIQIDRLSPHIELNGSIFNEDPYIIFGIVFGGLRLFPEGPRTRECPEGPGTL